MKKENTQNDKKKKVNKTPKEQDVKEVTKVSTKKKASSSKEKLVKDKKKKKKENKKSIWSMFIKDDKKKKKEVKKFDGRFNLDILDILIIIVLTSILSCVLTGFVLNYQFKKSTALYDKKLITDENVNKFLNTYSEIIDNYYEEVDEKAMMEAAISGMLTFLEDNYSIYLDKDETDSLSEILDGSYEGIGIISVENVVYSVYKDSPAEKAGIKENDEIIKVNGENIDKTNFEQISVLIEKNDKDKNEIVVKRDGKELTFYVEKANVNVPVTNSDVIKSKGNKIGYLSLSAFSSHSFEEFQDKLLELEDDKIDSLIIDLRNNTGGYLKSAYNIASLFIPKGKVIYSLESKNKITTEKDDTDDKREYKIVVLVNGSTASAAEILTAALHDSYGATVVGNVTFGKGKVQTMVYYEDTMMKYTSAKWLRPNGECIDEIGITPDYEVNLEYKDNTIYDKQLDKAISLLS